MGRNRDIYQDLSLPLSRGTRFLLIKFMFSRVCICCIICGDPAISTLIGGDNIIACTFAITCTSFSSSASIKGRCPSSTQLVEIDRSKGSYEKVTETQTDELNEKTHD